MMKKFWMKMLLVGVITVFPQLFLKAEGEDDDPTDPGPDPDEIPLDPGSWILAAAGVGYGLKKWRDAQQNGKKDIYRIGDITPENKVIDEY
ncbi:MAG TPA: hypothetical protein VFW07_06480 [Parafilimonas sp.]|nr:hypothetical protein [Parafilimonas sp.]